MIDFENVEIYYGDVLDKETLKKALEDVDTVFHLAAVVDYSQPEELMFNTNVIGTRNVLEFFKGSKFIYLSTADVLGKKIKEPATENTPYKPSNFYAKTKMEAEKTVKENNGIIVRSPDALMPKFLENYDFIFSKLQEGKISIVGDGKNFIDFINVRDLIHALLLTQEKGRKGEIYNVCGKGIKTQKEFLEIACKYLNVEAPKKHASTISIKLQSLGSRLKSGQKFMSEYMDKIQRDRTFDIAKAKNEIGFEPFLDLEDSIKEMTEDYLERSNKEQEEVAEEQSEQES